MLWLSLFVMVLITYHGFDYCDVSGVSLSVLAAKFCIKTRISEGESPRGNFTIENFFTAIRYAGICGQEKLMYVDVAWKTMTLLRRFEVNAKQARTVGIFIIPA